MYIWLVFCRELKTQREREREMDAKSASSSSSSFSSSIFTNYPLISAFTAFAMAQFIKVFTSWYFLYFYSFSLSLSLFLVFFYWVFLLSCDSLFWIWLGFRFLFATIQIQFDDGVCLFRLNILWFCFFLLTGFGLAQILKWIWTVLETYEVNLIKFFFKSQVSLGSNFFFLFWWHLATFNSINPHQDNGLLLTRYDFSNWLDLWGQCISSYMF